MITLEMQNLQQIIREFSSLGSELPKAITKGLNRTGETLIERQRLEMQGSIKGGPVPFTLNAHRQWKARPQPGKMDTVVFVMDKQADYLQSSVFGKDYTGLAPGPGVRLNQYGNIPNKKGGLAAIKGKLRSDGEFIGRVRGVARRGRYAGQPFDIFARWGRMPYRRGQPRSLVVIAKSVVNKDREITLRWYEVAEDWANRKLPEYIQNEIDLAFALYGRNARV